MSLLSGKDVRRPSGLLSELLQEAGPHPSPGRIITGILSFRCREGLSSSVMSDQHLLFGGTAGPPAVRVEPGGGLSRRLRWRPQIYQTDKLQSQLVPD